MNLYFWTFIVLRFLLALGIFIFLPRSLLPLKQGWQNNDQKLLTKGSVLFILGLMCLFFFIFIMNKG